ncbi:excinuclease ABC subunit C [Salinarchaeum laminariae]|uniref:excinuclease ABC subunit C n=1 Tax=Salinarchaeum laminariae TaxID=869888 RepID=UPI0020BDBB7F|nr:excinuclease ABC subunit C [Salinarchaeum laminariae]
MDTAAVRELANDLPRESGVYQFRATEDRAGGDAAGGYPADADAGGHTDAGTSDGVGGGDGTVGSSGTERVLYVGKAVDLRDRVRSYADPRGTRIARMVENADNVEVAVTDTETQALLLEANLIKRHQPRYNVRLTDDKSYPLVQFTDHEVPRIEITRDPDEGATVYGPFTDRGELETIVKAIRELYGLRGCSDHKYSGRDRPCLDYEIGLCTAPCTGEISAEAYAEDVLAAKRFFEGETGALADPLRQRMGAAAQDQAFERAASFRDRLETVEAFHGEGEDVVSHAGSHDGGHGVRTHVLGAAVEGREPTVAVLESEGGKLVDRHRPPLAVPESAREDPASLLAAFVPQYYADRRLPDVLLLPEEPADAEVRAWLEDRDVDVRVPGAGREARLVDLALKNARRAGPGRDPCLALADALGIDSAQRVEGFDVSHAGGKATVGSNVLAVDGAEQTDGYRRKKLPEGNDDPGSMYELLRWRAARAVEGRDDRPDPDVLLIDGGSDQLDAARRAIDAAGWEIPLVAIAKGEIGDRDASGDRILGSDGRIDVPDEALRLCQRVRDEAHRFAVQYHQTVRDDVSTALDEIDGVGSTTREALLARFGSIESIRSASRDELEDVDGVGSTTANTLIDRL